MYMYLLLCYCIGYTSNNDWSTSIISALHYTVVPDIIGGGTRGARGAVAPHGSEKGGAKPPIL